MKLHVLALGGALIAGPAIANPEPVCGPHEIIATALIEEAQEAPVARMLASDGIVVEILAAADGSTYSILLVRPDGIACIASVGTGFEFVTTAIAPTPGTQS